MLCVIDAGLMPSVRGGDPQAAPASLHHNANDATSLRKVAHAACCLRRSAS